MSKHTAGEWGIGPVMDESFVIIEVGGTFVAQTVGGNDEANAEFIVRACNAHDDLLEALKAIVEDVTDEEHEPHDWSEHVVIRNARAAIARAEVES